ncbi:MAG TPA: hypothetical protein VM576_05295 [Xanthomonadaceae bacterium]|nr:hypothetical protein [Xanthomonadaceae bacterium]
MIHHVSIPAADPRHVAQVLGELLGGYAGPFIGPIPGAWVAYADDAHGTGIEVYPAGTTLVPGSRDDEQGQVVVAEAPAAVAFHVLLSVPARRETIEAVGAREGWRTRHFWRGPPGNPLFELYEFWVENRVMLELATADMVPAYARIANAGAQRLLLAKRALR